MIKKLGFKGGLLLGLVLAVACSSSADNINNAVNTIVHAIDVLFDGSGSSLSSTNVQDALKELDNKFSAEIASLKTKNTLLEDMIKERLVFIEDDLGSDLGYLLNATFDNDPTNPTDTYTVYYPPLKAIANLVVSGVNAYDVKSGFLRFPQTNCLGQTYIDAPLYLVRNLNQIFLGEPNSTYIGSQSYKDENGNCINNPFNGPLYVAQDVTSQYPIYIQAPLKRVEQ